MLKFIKLFLRKIKKVEAKKVQALVPEKQKLTPKLQSRKVKKRRNVTSGHADLAPEVTLTKESRPTPVIPSICDSPVSAIEIRTNDNTLAVNKVSARKTRSKRSPKSSVKLAKRLAFRVSETEYSDFNGYAKDKHLTTSVILRRFVQDPSCANQNVSSPIKCSHSDNITNQLHHLKRIGNNLNQATRALNTIKLNQQDEVSVSHLVVNLNATLGDLQTLFSKMLDESDL